MSGHSRNRSRREPHRHDAERYSRYERGAEVLPLGAVSCRVCTRPSDNRPAQLLSARDPHTARPRRPPQTIDLNRTIAVSRDGSDVCAASRSMALADRFCREHDELRNFLRSRSRHPPTSSFSPPSPNCAPHHVDRMITSSNLRAAPPPARDVTEPRRRHSVGSRRPARFGVGMRCRRADRHVWPANR